LPVTQNTYKLTKEVVKDENGNVERTSTFTYNQLNQLTRVARVFPSDTNTYTLDFTYDLFGNLSTKLANNTNLTTYGYSNGLITTSTHTSYNENFLNTYTYNSLGQMVNKNLTADGDSVDSESYTYNNDGNIATSQNDMGSIMEYGYDNKNNVKKLLFTEAYCKIEKYGNNNMTYRRVVGESLGWYLTYEYNENNYPTKVFGFDYGTLISTKEYTYNW